MIQGLRNLQPLDEQLPPPDTVIHITGANGAGKTALLEAIHLVATGRSFRENRLQRCQQWQTEQMTIFVELNNRAGHQQLGWQRHKQHTTLKLNGGFAHSQADLAWHCPVQVFSPESHDQLTQGSQERRRLLDWGAFYQQPNFLNAWRHYQHALRQRNQALRQGLPDSQIINWHTPMWEAAQQIDQARSQYLIALDQHLPAIAAHISDDLCALSVSYHRGWSKEQSLPEIWLENMLHDRQLGYTQVGPHRADLKIRLQDRDALTICSRGQQKLIALMLLLAQTRILQHELSDTPILLLDDLPAELDQHHLMRVLTFLPQLNAQCFFTTTLNDPLPVFSKIQHWHLVQGQLTINTS